jgi:hypothetical protein
MAETQRSNSAHRRRVSEAQSRRAQEEEAREAAQAARLEAERPVYKTGSLNRGGKEHIRKRIHFIVATVSAQSKTSKAAIFEELATIADRHFVVNSELSTTVRTTAATLSRELNVTVFEVLEAIREHAGNQFEPDALGRICFDPDNAFSGKHAEHAASLREPIYY